MNCNLLLLFTFPLLLCGIKLTILYQCQYPWSNTKHISFSFQTFIYNRRAEVSLIYNEEEFTAREMHTTTAMTNDEHEQNNSNK